MKEDFYGWRGLEVYGFVTIFKAGSLRVYNRILSFKELLNRHS